MNKIYQKLFPGDKNAGFTLIELLVVVLIIGILSAVALPQYQKAVAKSRTAEILVAAKAIETAERVYYMANGEYTTDLDALDMEFPDRKKWSLRIYPPSSNVSGWMAEINYQGLNITYQRYFDLPYDQCVAYSEIQDYLCKDLGGSFSATQGDHRIYRIEKK